MIYIENDTRLTISEQKQIVELALLGRVLFANPTLPQLFSAMIAMIAEKMLDGAFPSIDWVNKSEIQKYNSLDGVNELEKIVRSNIMTLMEDAESRKMRTVWMDIVDEINIELTSGYESNYLSSPDEKQYYGSDVNNKKNENIIINNSNSVVLNNTMKESAKKVSESNGEHKVNNQDANNDSKTTNKKFKWSEHLFLIFIIDVVVVALFVAPSMAVSEGLAIGLGAGGQAIVFIVFGILISREKNSFKK